VIGLALIVPLGDLLERRRLTTALLLAAAAAAAGVMVVLALIMWRALPPSERAPYRSALASVLTLLASESAFAGAALLTWAVTQRLGIGVSPGAVTVVSARPNAATAGPVGQVDAGEVRPGERPVDIAGDGERDARAAAMVERQVVRGDP
jgi:hypothetical protein